MKGLLYKDIRCLLKNMSPAYFMCLIPILVYWNKGVFLYVLALIVGYFFGIQTLLSISIDEQSGFSSVYRLLPISKYKISISKYLFMLLMMAASAVFVTFITSIFEKEIILNYGLLSAYVVFLYDILMIPISLFFGVEKGRYVVIIVAVVPLIFSNYVIDFITLIEEYIAQNSTVVYIVFILVNFTVLVISYAVACMGINRYSH